MKRTPQPLVVPQVFVSRVPLNLHRGGASSLVGGCQLMHPLLLGAEQ